MITNWTKLGLLPFGAEYLHALENGAFADYSGNGRHITASSNAPDVVSNFIGDKPGLYFDGTKNPLVNNTSQSVKHIFIVAKYQNATFAGNEGLLSDTANIPLLIGGNAGTNIFYNNGQGISYWKDNQPFAENAKSAPMNAWSLLEIQYAGGIGMQGWQIGRDRADNSRRWIGGFAEDSAFDRILSKNDRRKAIFYYNLKFGKYFATPIALEFPDKDITGIEYARFNQLPGDDDEITVEHKYQDGGKSFNETSDAPPARWEIGFTGLTYDQMRIFEEFKARVRISNTFDFTDKWGEKHSGVRIEKYERDHEAHISTIYSVKFKLVKY